MKKSVLTISVIHRHAFKAGAKKIHFFLDEVEHIFRECILPTLYYLLMFRLTNAARMPSGYDRYVLDRAEQYASGQHDDVIKWMHFPRYGTFVRGIHRSPVNSPHKGQWRGALMFSLIHAWTNGWINNRDAGDLRHSRAHYDVTVVVPRNTWRPSAQAF